MWNIKVVLINGMEPDGHDSEQDKLTYPSQFVTAIKMIMDETNTIPEVGDFIQPVDRFIKCDMGQVHSREFNPKERSITFEIE